MNESNLASEVIHEQKIANKRMFVAFIITLFMFFLSNIAWLIAWNLPDTKTVQTYEMQGEDNANVIYNEKGDVKVNGRENQDNEENNVLGEQQTTQ